MQQNVARCTASDAVLAVSKRTQNRESQLHASAKSLVVLGANNAAMRNTDVIFSSTTSLKTR